VGLAGRIAHRVLPSTFDTARQGARSQSRAGRCCTPRKKPRRGTRVVRRPPCHTSHVEPRIGQPPGRNQSEAIVDHLPPWAARVLRASSTQIDAGERDDAVPGAPVSPSGWPSRNLQTQVRVNLKRGRMLREEGGRYRAPLEKYPNMIKRSSDTSSLRPMNKPPAIVVVIRLSQRSDHASDFVLD